MRYSNNNVLSDYQEIKLAFELLAAPHLTEEQRKISKQRILSLLPYFQHRRYPYADTVFPFRLFRARSGKSISSEDALAQVKTFSYPSPEKCQVERANVKGCPVFYVSDQPEAALRETGVEAGETAYLSEWKLESPEHSCLYLIFTDGIPDNHPWKAIHRECMQDFDRWLADQPLDDQKKWRQLEQLFCQAFLSDDYAISSLIGHQLLYGGEIPQIHALVYPSRADNEIFCNLAMHPDFADQQVKPVRFLQLSIADHTGSNPGRGGRR
jgi:hypothetical protein